MINLEDRMTVEQLRKEVRRLWNNEINFSLELANLPEVPSYETLILLSHNGFPVFWNIGKDEQKRLPYGSVPAKTEAEIGMGRWKIIRDALKKHQPIPASDGDDGA